MLKIVPDPPHLKNSPSLEDTLVEASDYVLCALTTAHQARLLYPRAPGSIALLTVMHELETARMLVESALAQVNLRNQPCSPTSH